MHVWYANIEIKSKIAPFREKIFENSVILSPESRIRFMDTIHRNTLYGLDYSQLADLCTAEDWPRFMAGQLARWLYKRHVEDPAQMTDLAAVRRERLAESFGRAFSASVRESRSADGTKKYLFRTSEGHFIESAYIPDGERATLCVSSQAGCRMGCRFCATGRQGLQQSLPTAEILNQIVSLPERDTLTNVVFMGMGEPLDNLENVVRALDILTSDWGFAGRRHASRSRRQAWCRSCAGSSMRRVCIWLSVCIIRSRRSGLKSCPWSVRGPLRRWPKSCVNTTLRTNAAYRSNTS